MTAVPEYHLFIDDSGSRDPDRRPKHNRDDRMDRFALGGILIKEEDTDELKSLTPISAPGMTSPIRCIPIRSAAVGKTSVG